MSINVLSFFYHLFIFLLGILVSYIFTIILIYIITSTTSNDHIKKVTSFLFPSKQSKSNILIMPSNEISFHCVWMFGIIISHIKFHNRSKLRPMYLKLYQQYLFIHLTSKRIKNFNHNKIVFSEVIIFDISQIKIELKPYEQIRTQYWSNKTPIVLSQLRFLARYRIDKKKKTPQQQLKDKKFIDHLQQLVFKWFINKDEIHLYTLTMRSKEEWFYRLYNSKLLFEEKSINSTEYKTIKSYLFSSNNENINIPIDKIEIEYKLKKSFLNINKNKLLKNSFSSIKINYNSLFERKKNFSNISLNQTWYKLMKKFFKKFYFSKSKQSNDYLYLINHLIIRCTNNLNIKKFFQKKIQYELKHLKLPYYIQWIYMSNIYFDNIYPKIKNFQKLWFNHNGLWIAIDLIYQGYISIEFKIKINLIDKQNKYSFILTNLKRLFFFQNNIQIFKKIINTILIITINIRSINGILLINIPCPPSDRIWFGFEEMPLIDFDVHHRYHKITLNSLENKSHSSINIKNYSNKQLNQLQITINNLLNQWIKKQIYKQYVLPNMHDICMKWCNNPFKKTHLLILNKTEINNLIWLNENNFRQLNKKFYLIAQWKQKRNLIKLYKKHRMILSKKIFLTDKFLIYQHC